MADTDNLWPEGGYGLRVFIDAKTEEEAFTVAQKLANQLRVDVTVLRTFTGGTYIPYHEVKQQVFSSKVIKQRMKDKNGE